MNEIRIQVYKYDMTIKQCLWCDALTYFVLVVFLILGSILWLSHQYIAVGVLIITAIPLFLFDLSVWNRCTQFVAKALATGEAVDVAGALGIISYRVKWCGGFPAFAVDYWKQFRARVASRPDLLKDDRVAKEAWSLLKHIRRSGISNILVPHREAEEFLKTNCSVDQLH